MQGLFQEELVPAAGTAELGGRANKLVQQRVRHGQLEEGRKEKRTGWGEKKKRKGLLYPPFWDTGGRSVWERTCMFEFGSQACI